MTGVWIVEVLNYVCLNYKFVCISKNPQQYRAFLIEYDSIPLLNSKSGNTIIFTDIPDFFKEITSRKSFS